MSRYRGGCLCGELRYEAMQEPTLLAYCYCADCRKVSGSGFIPFMGFARGDAVRNSCAVCGGLVFGTSRWHSARHRGLRPVGVSLRSSRVEAGNLGRGDRIGVMIAEMRAYVIGHGCYLHVGECHGLA
jgi:hypothetical protein